MQPLSHVYVRSLLCHFTISIALQDLQEQRDGL